jgi:excisionase family DNA binding protein
VRLEDWTRGGDDMGEVITPAEVAALLQIHVKTVYRLVRQGVLPGRQIGRRWRFSRTEILALVSSPWQAPNGEHRAPADAP